MKRKRHNYKNLKIWKLALEIAMDVSDKLEKFPKLERYSLTSQMSRCSVSLPSNVAEGSARTAKMFNNYLDIAIGSSFELQTQLIIANHKKYIKEKELEELSLKIDEWQRMTFVFQNNLIGNR
ncbi:MAG: four helix bundle protein [Flavobacteriaceae bacterium]|nr:four helix bundle protein [Flavobacteriaceae bacterium]